nr:transporter substrate-binding domain-containing protein [Nitrosomonas nitrosa]
MERIKQTGEVRIGTSLMAPAFDIFMCYRNDDLIGFDADVARHIVEVLSRKLNQREPLKVKFRIYEWRDLLEAVESGKVDLVIAGLTNTRSRRNTYKILFTNPYTIESLSYVLVFTAKSSDSDPTGTSVVVQPPKITSKTTLIAPRGTTQQNLAELLSDIKGGRVELVDTFTDGVAKLRRQPDMILVGDEGFSSDRFRGLSLFRLDEAWIKSEGGERKFTKEILEKHNLDDTPNFWKNPLSIAVASNQEQWKEELNTIIENEMSRLKDIQERWFPQNDGKDTPAHDPSRKCGLQQIDGYIYSSG